MDKMQKRREYREAKLESVKAVRAHNGSRQSFEKLIQVLAKFEKWIGENFENGASRASDETEELVAMEYSNSKYPTINDLLMYTSRRIERLVKGELSPQQIAENLGIQFVEIDQPLLPSNGEGGIPNESVGKEKYRPPKYIPKLQMLLGLLQRLEIFSDEIIITSGINLHNMIRKEPYALVEFKSTGKEILICNESGQATYISHLQYGAAAYTDLSKSEIVRQPGVTKINYIKPEQWEKSMKDFLSTGRVELIVVNYENENERTIILPKRFFTWQDELPKDVEYYLGAVLGGSESNEYRFSPSIAREIQTYKKREAVGGDAGKKLEPDSAANL